MSKLVDFFFAVHSDNTVDPIEKARRIKARLDMLTDAERAEAPAIAEFLEYAIEDILGVVDEQSE